MRCRKSKTKAESVTDELREMICSGKFTSGQLPKEKQLIEYFQVSRKTILHAMNILSEEGLLRRVKGTGTFIQGRDKFGAAGDNPELIRRMAVMAMPLYGHYFSLISDAIHRALQERHLFAVSYNIEADYFDNLIKQANLTTLLSSPIRGLMIHGGGYWRNPLLEDWSNLRSVFIDYFDYDGSPPWSAVLVDYEAGSVAAVRHLLQQGRRKIAFACGPNRVTIPMSPSHWANHPRRQMEVGCRRAAGEGGADYVYMTIPEEDDAMQMEFAGLIAAGIDSVVFQTDFLAVRFCQYAREKQIRIPEDIAVIGQYNTPWCQEGPVELTSIDVRPGELGLRAVELLLSGEELIEKLTPQLVVRASTKSKL